MTEARTDPHPRVQARVARAFLAMLPGLVWQAHGYVPDSLQSAVSRDDLVNVFRASARAGLIRAGCLTQDELATLSIRDATQLAQRRFLDQHPELQRTRPPVDGQEAPTTGEKPG